MASEPEGYRRGSAGYQRITLALFAAGMTTFVAMYGMQAVLPQVADDFDASPATSALTVSATTGALALMVIPASVLSERFGRLRVMTTSAVVSAGIGIVLPWVSSLGLLIALRGLQGVALAGVPATAMAYLAEEVHPADLGAAMARYVAGTTLGGLAGRLLASFTLDLETWRWALEVVALASLAFTALMLALAPRSRFFTAQPIGIRHTGRNLAEHLRNPTLLALFMTAFLLMGGFVSAYNVLGFRLLAQPFGLPAAIVGLVFLLYLSGTVSSSLAGRWADRWGRAKVLVASECVMILGLLLSLPDSLPMVLIGMLALTAGFFAAHAVASGWVGVVANQHRAEASSLYLAGYYLGSSVLGALAGLAWSAAGWSGVVIYIGALLCAALALVAVARRRVRARAAGGVTVGA
ncbi:MFS transporter [Dermacoccaceae bacterium W4C1]